MRGGTGHLGDPEVHDLAVSGSVDHDIGRLDVSMEYSVFMGVLKGFKALFSDPECLVKGKQVAGMLLHEFF
jgi:hypothetical protein